MSNPRYKVRNKNAIERGFKSLKTQADSTENVVMRNIARDLLHQLLRFHDEYDAVNHQVEENTLAYALAHNGTIVESGFHRGGDKDDLPGDALEQATDVATSNHGWVAVILSDMMGFYDFPKEEDMLHDTASEIDNRWGTGLHGSSKYLTPGAIQKPE